MRLIDADALKEKICNNVYPIVDFFNSRDYGMFWTGGIEKAINEAPTIDAEPVKHGKLMRTEAYPHRLYCSECFKTLIPNEEICFEKNEFPKYCMWCGAKLDEEDTP